MKYFIIIIVIIEKCLQCNPVESNLHYISPKTSAQQHQHIDKQTNKQ